MKDKKVCRIIQDLLPNYIEKLTNEETNKYIEEHLKECEECEKILKNMKKEIRINTEKRDNREVKYIKKYNTRIKILTSVILLIFIIFTITTARKIIIVTNLQKKSSEYIKSTENFHRVIYSYSKDYYQKTEYFKMGEKQRVIQTKLTENGKEIWQAIGKEKIINKYGIEVYLVNIYKEYNGYKEVVQNKELSMNAEPQSPFSQFDIEGFGKMIIHSIQSSIKTVTYNGEECYYITNFGDIGYIANGAYISKETGLPISIIAYEYEDDNGKKGRTPASDYFYEFNTVTEEDFIEPDITEYKIR